MYYIGNLGILAHNVYYEPSSEQVTTKRGNINPAPRNPEEVLKSSIPISENSTRRIGVDYDANEFNYPLFNLKSNYDLWLKTEKRQKCGRNVAFSPRIGHFGRESATVDKKEREPEFELRFPEFRQKNGRDREI